MKRPTIILTLCLIFTLSYGMKVSAGCFKQIVVQESDSIDCNYVFGSKKPIKISLEDEYLDKDFGEFCLLYMNEDGVYVLGPSDSYSADINDCIVYPERIPFDKVKPVPNKSEKRDYYTLRVVYTSTGADLGHMDLRFAKPASPVIISDVSFTYTYNWEWDYLNLDSWFSLNVHSSGATNVLLYYTMPFQFEFDRHQVCFVEQFNGRDTIPVTYDANWGEFCTFSAGNDFGYTPADTMLLTTDYITDEDILRRIQSLKDPATAVNCPTADRYGLKWQFTNKKLVFNIQPESIFVYDAMGRSLISGYLQKSIDLSEIPSGIYLVVVAIRREDENLDYKTIKIINP